MGREISLNLKIFFHCTESVDGHLFGNGVMLIQPNPISDLYDDNRFWVKRSEYRLEMPVELIHKLKKLKPKIRNLQYDLINSAFPPSTPSH